MNVSAPAKPADVAAAPASPVRVMIVDDALVARGFVKRWVDAEPDLELVGSLRDGREAINRLDAINPDVVVLDVEMPDMDGITALPLLLQKKPNLAVIMASTLTRRNAEISLRALSLGALDCIPKPEGSHARESSAEFRRELINKIRELGNRARTRPGRPRSAAPVSPSSAPAPLRVPATAKLPQVEQAPALAPAAAPVVVLPHTARHVLVSTRPFPKAQPRVLLIGASTGGPQALNAVMAGVAPVIDRAPVLITQHMPPTFTTILAEHLSRVSGRKVAEAVDGEAVVPGRVYLAPGGRHMIVRRQEKLPVIALTDDPPVHFCKPAVDPLFASAAEIWGQGAYCAILTGMGCDGTDGAAKVVEAGGAVIAQDEATSVVWGMPGSVAEAGLCSAVLPIESIAQRIVRSFLGERP